MPTRGVSRPTRALLHVSRPDEAAAVFAERRLQRERLQFEMMGDIDFELEVNQSARALGTGLSHQDISGLCTDKRIDCSSPCERRNRIAGIDTLGRQNPCKRESDEQPCSFNAFRLPEEFRAHGAERRHLEDLRYELMAKVLVDLLTTFSITALSFGQVHLANCLTRRV